MLGIMVGKHKQPNQLLINNGGDGSFTLVDLPGGDMDTESIALGDVDGDGMLDIVVGNDNQPNQLLINNGGDGSFTLVDLPGGD